MLEQLPCPKCWTGTLLRQREEAPDWAVAEGVRAFVVVVCPECDFVGFEDFHPAQKFSSRMRSHMQRLEAQARALALETS